MQMKYKYKKQFFNPTFFLFFKWKTELENAFTAGRLGIQVKLSWILPIFAFIGPKKHILWIILAMSKNTAKNDTEIVGFS